MKKKPVYHLSLGQTMDMRNKVKLHQKKLTKIAKNLLILERKILAYGPINPASLELGSAMIKCAWAIQGALNSALKEPEK